MSEAPSIRLRRLISEFKAGALETRLFCAQFERTYNLELDKSTLSSAEAAAFGPLFEEVIWFSPFPEERAQYPGYRSEADIARAAEIAAQRLGEGDR
jgi:hypothetical protein